MFNEKVIFYSLMVVILLLTYQMADLTIENEHLANQIAEIQQFLNNK